MIENRIIIKNTENYDFSLMSYQEEEINEDLATIVFDWFLLD